MTDLTTLRTLVEVARRRPVVRDLACPECGNEVGLSGPGYALLYRCGVCLSEFGELRELVVKGERI